MKSDNDTLCHIVEIGGMLDPRRTVVISQKAHDAAKKYQEYQKRPKDGTRTRYMIEVKNKHGKWPELGLNEDDDTETIVRLINEAAQSPY